MLVTNYRHMLHSFRFRTFGQNWILSFSYCFSFCAHRPP